MSLSLSQYRRHQMETFFDLLSLCDGNPSLTGGFPIHRPVTWSFDVLMFLRLNKRLSKLSIRWWFKTPSRSSWRHYNALVQFSFVEIVLINFVFLTYIHINYEWSFKEDVLVSMCAFILTKLCNAITINRWWGMSTKYFGTMCFTSYTFTTFNNFKMSYIYIYICALPPEFDSSLSTL